jgi:heme A synthase
MIKYVALLITLFFLSAILTTMLHPAALLVVGAVICVTALLKNLSQKNPTRKLRATLLFRSWLAIMAGAIVAITSALAAMYGLFSI